MTIQNSQLSGFAYYREVIAEMPNVFIYLSLVLYLKVRTATSTEQFSPALKTRLFTLDYLVAHPGASDSLFPLMNYGAVYKWND